MSTGILPWQRGHWQRLQTLERGGRLPHALLFSGGRGLGKRRLAETLCRWLLCDRHAELDANCGECRGCALASAGSHPDFERLRAEEGKTTIGIDPVRVVIGRVQLTPSHGYRKLVLVERADDLTVAAANSLLKVLEEPPGTALFLLVADRPAALPVTIRSRCQRLAFRAPPVEEALAWLAEQGAGADAPRLLEIAAGAPLRALDLGSSEALAELTAIAADIQSLFGRREDPVRVARRWSALPVTEIVAGVSAAVAAETRRNVLQQTESAGHPSAQPLDSTRLFEVLDECARVRALVERRTLSATEQVMVAQRLALACSLAMARAPESGPSPRSVNGSR